MNRPGVHIIKLISVVDTITTCDDFVHAQSPDTVDTLISIAGAMLPFGFVVLPVVAYLPGVPCWRVFKSCTVDAVSSCGVLSILGVFVSVTTIVYSTVFHQTGELFWLSQLRRDSGLNQCHRQQSLDGASTIGRVDGERARLHGFQCRALVATLPLFWCTGRRRLRPRRRKGQPAVPLKQRKLSFASSLGQAGEESPLLVVNSPIRITKS